MLKSLLDDFVMNDEYIFSVPAALRFTDIFIRALGGLHHAPGEPRLPGLTSPPRQ